MRLPLILRCPLVPVMVLAQIGCFVSAQVLRGPLLGQGTAPKDPQRFAPGVVNQGLPVRDMAISPDGQHMVWGVSFQDGPVTLVGVHQVKGVWTKPEVLPFATDPTRAFLEPCFSPDGKSLVFCSDHGTLPDGRKNWDFFRVSLEEGRWGQPKPLGAPINTEANEYFPSLTQDGTLYFCRDEMPKSRAHFLYRSRLVDGMYQSPEKLPAHINAKPSQFNAFIARDESYLIWSAAGFKSGMGGVDYLIAFRRADDIWSQPMVVLEPISTKGSEEYSASTSPDGKALFFMTRRADREPKAWTLKEMKDYQSLGYGQSAIFWMDAAILERYRKGAVFPE